MKEILYGGLKEDRINIDSGVEFYIFMARDRRRDADRDGPKSMHGIEPFLEGLSK